MSAEKEKRARHQERSLLIQQLVKVFTEKLDYSDFRVVKDIIYDYAERHYHPTLGSFMHELAVELGAVDSGYLYHKELGGDAVLWYKDKLENK